MKRSNVFSTLCVLLLVVSQLVLAVGVGAQAPQKLRLATTTSTADSGLLDYILPFFEKEANTKVDVVAVGTGQAIEIGTKGDADVLLVHSRKAEDQFVKDGHAAQRFDVMYNDFIVLGPKEDPAKAAALTAAKDVFKAIANAQANFASRGDKSGTNTKELTIWATAGITPTVEMAWYKSLGQGMGETLLFSNEQKAYTLSDRGTYLSMKDKLKDLVIILGGNNINENKDAGLLNPYGVMVVDPWKHPGVNAEMGQKFVSWMLSVPTQKLINNYGKDKFGQSLFYADSTAYRASLVNIFHAGSLAQPLKELIAAYAKKQPETGFRLESAGSVDSARKISEQGKIADIMMSADYKVIDDLLIPKFATWNIRFARNDMVIGYTDKSKFAAEIQPANWFDILLREGVAYGHTDPNKDPGGYRAVMVWQLAEKFYQKPGLFGQLNGAPATKNVVTADPYGDIKAGKLDYIFSYRTTSMQNGLKFVELPVEVNLSDPGKADLYATVKVELTNPDGSKSTVAGLPIVYGLTIPSNARHPNEAADFVKFVIGPEGQAIMQKLGQPPIVPAKVVDPKTAPAELQSLLAP
jgi:tungstate transport system substrate-binding protein